MITSRIVVGARPFQVLLACASMIFAILDQQYRTDDKRLLVVLVMTIPATLLTVTVAVHTIWGFISNNEYSRGVGTVRWTTDFVIFLILGATIPVLLIVWGPYGSVKPPLPYCLIWIIADGTASLLLLLTAVLLAIEDIRRRRTKPLLTEVSPKYAAWRSDIELSEEVSNFYNRVGAISYPTTIQDPETFVEAHSRGIIHPGLPSRFSSYGK